ncbi:heavy metal translocating P-type ATPase [Candidatus Woesebacteria bacterium]|nr:heavy metal translocating P-type ATPase [Candidatus Woesebacteria bacterium]
MKPKTRIPVWIIEYKIPVLMLVFLLVYGVLYLLGERALIRYILLIPIIVGLIPLAREMVGSILRKHFGVDIIALLAIVSATLVGEYLAAVVVLLMLSGGEALERFALKRARKELTSLLNNAPQFAHLRKDDQLVDVAIDEVRVGDTVIIKPGEIIPIDGKVTKGTSEVDESALTGESVLVEKVPHMFVLSGSVNKHSVLEVRALKPSSESQYAQIIRLVQEAERSKAPFVRLADRYSVWFTAIAIALAFTAWITSGEVVRAIAVLVVATPCPLILATPIAFASGISRAAKRGVIIKHGGAMEKLAQARSFMFDKTGTITFGTPKLTKILPFAGRDKTDITHVAASLDQLSGHILARAFQNYAKQNGIKRLSIPTTFEESLGNGVQGTVDGVQYSLGRLSYMDVLGVHIPADIQSSREKSKQEGVMTVYLASGGRLLGAFEFADTIRTNVKKLFLKLKEYGVEVIMLTGDRRSVAEHIGIQAGISRVYAECLPERKVDYVRQERKVSTPVVMVGDGVNDAPALAVADVGIALGAHGSSAASESGDVVVMVDNIERVGEVYELSRNVLRIAKESILVGIGLSILLMILAVLGFIQPVYGALMQEVIDVVVILNALRVHSSKVSTW